jgi:hypothetical protein
LPFRGWNPVEVSARVVSLEAADRVFPPTREIRNRRKQSSAQVDIRHVALGHCVPQAQSMIASARSA